jgi:hypothetical protein
MHLSHLCYSLGLIGLASLCATPATAQDRFVQDRFAIGFWVDPPDRGDWDVRYREIADANFTLVLGGFGATTKEAVTRQLALCEEYGLRAVVSPRDAASPEDYPDGPACWGYMMRDEPSAPDFAALRTWLDAIREARPGRLGYINLLPDYASPAQLGTATYEEHVQRFLDEVGVDVLSMDHYPIMRPGMDGRDGYCRNLESFRVAAQRAGVPFWNFFNTMPYGPHSDPTEAQLRWQVFASVAYGAKGVLYFCYWTPEGGEFPKGGAILTVDGRKTRHYEEARRINAVLKAWGPTLMRLTSEKVVRITPAPEPEALLVGTPIRGLTPGDYLIGCYTRDDGKRAVLLENWDITYAEWPTVEFDVPSDQVLEVDPATGAEAPVIDDSPAMEGLQISLDSGGARLFVLP